MWFFIFFYYVKKIAYIVYFQLSSKLFDLFKQRNSSISFFDRVILVKANKQKAAKSPKMFEFMKIDFWWECVRGAALNRFEWGCGGCVFKTQTGQDKKKPPPAMLTTPLRWSKYELRWIIKYQLTWFEMSVLACFILVVVSGAHSPHLI